MTVKNMLKSSLNVHILVYQLEAPKATFLKPVQGDTILVKNIRRCCFVYLHMIDVSNNIEMTS